MRDDELLADLEKYKEFTKKFYQKGQDCLRFKKYAERWFKEYRDVIPVISDLTKKSDLNSWMFNQMKARLFIGMGCEMLLKAIFLKNNCLINQFKEGKPERLKGKRDLIRISEIKEEEIDLERTFDYTFFWKRFEELIPEKYKINHKTINKTIKKGLGIANIWANRDKHGAVGLHREYGLDKECIEFSIMNLYNIFFVEDSDKIIKLLGYKINRIGNKKRIKKTQTLVFNKKIK